MVIFLFFLFSFIIGIVLAIAKKKFNVVGNPLVDKINNILPQTQCGQCNYPGCKPYAKAIAEGEAAINLCPPGGQEGVDALADLLAIDTMIIDAENTIAGIGTIAIIDENECIGCTLCIKACPVDAIAGASKVMTTVIEEECTGCELCIPVCPVDCIAMVPIKETINNYIPKLNETHKT